MWQTFGYGATVTNVKVVRDESTGALAGHGFVEFPSTYEAEQVLAAQQPPVTRLPAGGACHATSMLAAAQTISDSEC
jgi:hypothetical protein